MPGRHSLRGSGNEDHLTLTTRASKMAKKRKKVNIREPSTYISYTDSRIFTFLTVTNPVYTKPRVWNRPINMLQDELAYPVASQSPSPLSPWILARSNGNISCSLTRAIITRSTSQQQTKSQQNLSWIRHILNPSEMHEDPFCDYFGPMQFQWQQNDSQEH